MPFIFSNFTNSELNRYKSHLKALLPNAVHLPQKDVKIHGEIPLPKQCHENAQKYCDENTEYECVTGWLVIDGGEYSSTILLLPHSVIRDENGLMHEITPIHSLEPRPFLESDLSETDFVKLHTALSLNNPLDIRLVIVK